MGLRYGSMGTPRPSSSVNFKDNTTTGKEPPATPGGDKGGKEEGSDGAGAVKKGSAKKAASPKQATPAASAKGQGLPIYITYHLSIDSTYRPTTLTFPPLISPPLISPPSPHHPSLTTGTPHLTTPHLTTPHLTFPPLTTLPSQQAPLLGHVSPPLVLLALTIKTRARTKAPARARPPFSTTAVSPSPCVPRQWKRKNTNI